MNVKLNRREFLEYMAKIPAAGTLAAYGCSLLPALHESGRAPIFEFSTADKELLEEILRSSFRFFWEATNPRSGLVKDRSRADGPDTREIASIAATGFGLTALCVGEARGFQSSKQITERVLTTLRQFWLKQYQQHGFFYHFINVHTGYREWQSEISSIDTALLLCGVMVARQHFKDAEIQDLSAKIIDRVDWNWMLNGGSTLSHGWKPEDGFLKYRWDDFSEGMMIYLLGLGSDTHPLPVETWSSFKRPIFDFDGARYIGCEAPLFVHQYPHAWFDLRNKRDQYADYFENSRIATDVHRRWCFSLAKKFPYFGENLWGITASDSAHGYEVWGGPPSMGRLDGTLVPCAAGGSIAFLPTETLRVLHTMKERFGGKVWKQYGFVDAFNPATNWFDADVIGIDLGITMLMAENALTGFVWETFMKSPEAVRGLARAGFKSQTTPAKTMALPPGPVRGAAPVT